MVSPAARKKATSWLVERFEVSERRACRATASHRSTQRYTRLRRDEPELVARVRALCYERPRFGYRRVHVMLRRQGVCIGQRRLRRIYKAEGLAVRRRKRRRVAGFERSPRLAPERPNERWSMDFVSDQVADGRRFRVLNVVDDCTRESLAAEVARSIPGERVTRVLDRIAQERGYPKAVVSDNGPEFRGLAMDQWAYRHGIQLLFIEPGKPVQNAYCESYNGRFRDECLNSEWFVGLEDASQKIQAWRIDYNEVRPHGSLGHLPPTEFALTFNPMIRKPKDQALQ